MHPESKRPNRLPVNRLSMDWGRKHICDLASACAKAKQDPSLSPAQQQLFSDTHTQVKLSASLPYAGGMKNITTIIGMLCNACQNAGYQACPGRTHWQQPCEFGDKFLNTQP